VRNIAVEVHPPYTTDALAADLKRAGATFDIQPAGNKGGNQLVMLFG
jgi:hypothetical protein